MTVGHEEVDGTRVSCPQDNCRHLLDFLSVCQHRDGRGAEEMPGFKALAHGSGDPAHFGHMRTGYEQHGEAGRGSDSLENLTDYLSRGDTGIMVFRNCNRVAHGMNIGDRAAAGSRVRDQFNGGALA